MPQYRNTILSQLPDYIRQELQSHVVEVLSRTPLKLVVANTYEKQITYAKVKRHEAKGDYKRLGLEYATIQQQINYEDIVINAIPVQIIK